MVESLKERGAWFATARQAVAWFQKRRAVVFEGGHGSQEIGIQETGVRVTGEHAKDLPALRLRIYEAQRQDQAGSRRGAAYVERCFDQTLAADLPCLVK
jgi:hypothetical protein